MEEGFDVEEDGFADDSAEVEEDKQDLEELACSSCGLLEVKLSILALGSMLLTLLGVGPVLALCLVELVFVTVAEFCRETDLES